jgi:L-aspartate oxidase
MNTVTDTLVIGAGIAGARVALDLADAGRHVTVLAKTPLAGSASAQSLGGIAAALGPDDSPALHLEDTLAAGSGLCSEATARGVVERAPACIDWLIEQGVRFDRVDGGIDLTREGAHSRRRIVHVADKTGSAIMAVLGRRLREHPCITLLSRHVAAELLVRRDDAVPGGSTCAGARVLDLRSRTLLSLQATHVVLATGGFSGIYPVSTNAARPVGDGIALAWRAGCSVADLEMVQFHPTALRHPQAEGWLVTEAVRGEGGRLLLPDGERFLFRYHPLGELAPRDVVARAMHAEMQARRLDAVWLDISHADANFIRTRFPNTYARCARLGIDITRQPMPVAPAAHYCCGGIVTGGSGETGLHGLYAIGETAWTGLHGANRLASNSLLEGLVFGEAAGRAILADVPRRTPAGPRRFGEPRLVVHRAPPAARREFARVGRAIRRIMAREAGIVRSDRGLAAALASLEKLRVQGEALYRLHDASPELLEMRNLACVAVLVTQSALLRHESRGAHYSVDHPGPGPAAISTVLNPPQPAGARRLAVA